MPVHGIDQVYTDILGGFLSRPLIILDCLPSTGNVARACIRPFPEVDRCQIQFFGFVTKFEHLCIRWLPAKFSKGCPGGYDREGWILGLELFYTSCQLVARVMCLHPVYLWHV